jgi:cytochrome c nitrite reductase small subunit
LATFVLIGIVFTLVTIYTFQNPSSCANCHRMQGRVESWRSSQHNGIECTKCHTPHGLLIAVKSGIGLSKPNHHGGVQESDCKNCHSMTRQTVMEDGKHIAPKRHNDKNTGCLDCHSNTGHSRR